MIFWSKTERLRCQIQDILQVYLNDFIYFVNTSIYLSMWYHYQLHRNWNQCNFMDHKNLCQMILLEMSLCILYSMLCGLATAVAVRLWNKLWYLQNTWVLHRKRYVVQVLLLSWNSHHKYLHPNCYTSCCTSTIVSSFESPKSTCTSLAYLKYELTQTRTRFIAGSLVTRCHTIMLSVNKNIEICKWIILRNKITV